MPSPSTTRAAQGLLAVSFSGGKTAQRLSKAALESLAVSLVRTWRTKRVTALGLFLDGSHDLLPQRGRRT